MSASRSNRVAKGADANHSTKPAAPNAQRAMPDQSRAAGELLELPESRVAVDSALLDIAFDRLRLSVPMTIGVCVVFVGLLWPYFPSSLKAVWVVVMIAIAVARYGLWLGYSRAGPGASDDPDWRRWYTIGALAAGAGWAFGPVTLMPEADHVESILLVLTVLSVAAVSTALLVTHLNAMVCFQCAALVPTAVAMYATGGDVERIASAILMASLLSLVLVGRRLHLSTEKLLKTELRLSRSVHETEAALQRAEAASVVKSEFLATMSHEIRTPLNGVLGMNELLLDSALGAQQREWSEAVQSSGHHLLGVINDILDFSKMESGNLVLETVDFDLIELVQDTVHMFAHQADQKGLRLDARFEPAGTPFGLRGDPFRLRQILVNLIGNAIKFTPAGEVTVRVSLTDETGHDTAVELCVEDSGIGISATAQSRIFDHFAQADGSTTREFGGTGLGLTICRRLLALMDGSIRVESAVAQGSRFLISLRLPRASVLRVYQAPPMPDGKLAASTTQSTYTLKGRVLLVEDNPINQRLAQTMLIKLGLSITLASNGQDAVDQVCEQMFDLVLMDCHMPELDGYEATIAIRQLPLDRYKKLPIIALTANATEGDEQRCRAAGMDDFLSKPYTFKQLQAILARWLPAASQGATFVATAAAIAPTQEPEQFKPARPAINAAALDALRELSPERDDALVKQLMRTFIETETLAFLEIEQAIGNGDSAALRQLAHKHKSGSAAVGAESLSACYHQLEAFGSDKEISAACEYMADFRAEHERTLAYAHELLI